MLVKYFTNLFVIKCSHRFYVFLLSLLCAKRGWTSLQIQTANMLKQHFSNFRLQFSEMWAAVILNETKQKHQSAYIGRKVITVSRNICYVYKLCTGCNIKCIFYCGLWSKRLKNTSLKLFTSLTTLPDSSGK